MLFLLLACVRPPAPSAEPPARDQASPVSILTRVEPRGRRVVAVGDLHADRAATVDVLRLAGLIDEQERWVGGDTIFVQTGDVTDRGPDSKGVIDLLRSLVEPARRAGGDVVLLNGNHEVMNLQGDWRYVSDEDIRGFGGIEQRKRAFAPDGRYGAHLERLPVAAQVGDTVFVHGGITDSFARLGLDGLNRVAREHYRDPPGPLTHPVLRSDGPVWYRGYVRDPESTACPILERALATLGARRMVVGHTTQRTGRALTRCGGRLTVIDLGISAHYGRHLGVWESKGGKARMLYPDGTVELVQPPDIATGVHPE